MVRFPPAFEVPTLDVLIVNQDEVRKLLTMDVCIDAMEEVLRGLARGECTLPLRSITWLPEKVGEGGKRSTAFFPGYPLAMRGVGAVVGNAHLGGTMCS